MSPRLAPSLDPGALVVACRVVGHAHGERAVVRYQVTGPTGEATTLMAKLYADPERAHRLHRLLTELQARPAAGHHCAVPTPVAHLAELGMAVYLSSPGVPLDGLDRGGRRAG